MNVILLERIEKLGQMGDTVKVKAGYARNYLLPQNKALRATDANRKHFEAQRTELEAVNLKRRQEAEAVGEKMGDIKLIMVRSAGESGQLYGSVAARDIQEALKDEGYKVERRQVELDSVIKALGSYPVRLRLHPEVAVEITVTVARSLEEAQEQHAAAEFLEHPEDYDAEAEDALLDDHEAEDDAHEAEEEA
jgi:large subunit ribosomal protein L9